MKKGTFQWQSMIQISVDLTGKLTMNKKYPMNDIPLHWVQKISHQVTDETEECHYFVLFITSGADFLTLALINPIYKYEEGPPRTLMVLSVKVELAAQSLMTSCNLEP